MRMNPLERAIAKLVMAMFGASVAFSAQADIAWTLPTSGVVTSTTAGGVQVNVSGWADYTSGQSGYVNPSPDSAGANLNQFNVNGYGGGVGITTMQSDSPDHAVGNGIEWSNGCGTGCATYEDGPDEMVLFSFVGQAVTLKSVDIGYWSNDADITVLAYKGSASEATVKSDLDSSNWNGILGASSTATAWDNRADGWYVINHYWDFSPVGPDATSYDISADTLGKSSSYWLVGTLNKQFDGVTDGNYPDFVKIAGITGVVVDPPLEQGGGVPEPASLLLFAAGVTMFRKARGLFGRRG